MDIKRKKGYAAAERLNASKVVPLCMVGPGEVLGDIETLMKLKTYMQSAVATDKVEVFVLNAKNYERLVAQKNPSTSERLKLAVETKLQNRLRGLGEVQMPLFKHILYNMNRIERPPSGREDADVQLVTRKQLPDRDTLFKHLAKSYIKNEAELIEPMVPGSVYIRDVMRERARAREHLRTVRKQPLPVNRHKPIRLKRLNACARSNKQIMVDLAKQKTARESHERSSLVRSIRNLEMMDIKDELADSRTESNSLPNMSVLRTMEPVDRKKVEHLVKDELGLQLPRDPLESGFKPDVVKVNTPEKVVSNTPSTPPPVKVSGIPTRKVMKIRTRRVKKVKNAKKGESEGGKSNKQKGDVQESSANDLTLHLERTKTFITQIRAGSEPDMSRDHTRLDDFDAGESTSTDDFNVKKMERIKSATADLGEADTDYILPRPTRIPPISESGSTENIMDAEQRQQQQQQQQRDEKRQKTQAKLRFMNDMVRDQLQMAPENPSYRDWETGESSVTYLEDRITKFNQKQAEYLERPEPKCLPKLTRFMATVILNLIAFVIINAIIYHNVVIYCSINIMLMKALLPVNV